MRAYAIAQVATLVTVATASYIKPPKLPLAVRNPYLSLWVNSRVEPWETWPAFWNGQEIGMGIFARVPSTATIYSLLGRPQDALDTGRNYTYAEPTFLGYQYDSISTNLSYALKGATIDLVFSSPITPDSLLEQSLPASYLEVVVSGKTDVEVYVDVNGMWATGDRANVVQWDFLRSDTLQSWAVRRQTEQLFTESGDRSEWGTFMLTAPVENGIMYQSSVSGPLRRTFASTGLLANSYDTDYRGVMDDEPVFAFAKRFSANTTSSLLLTVALVQDPIVQFAAARGLTLMHPYWFNDFATAADMIAWHYSDYANATAQGYAFDARAQSDARRLISQTYADIVALSARQTLGANYIAGTPSDPLIWQKELSSSGNVNTVDVIFPTLPFFLYVNPEWLAYMLEPLLEHQRAGLYPHPYSMHDIGGRFPNATGHPDGNDEPMPVEESGNMLIMALSYAQTLSPEAASTWINVEGRYTLWTQWTQFLVDKGLIPDYQLSTDDFAGRLENQTNLAVKALLGIRAMSYLSDLAGYPDDAAKYLKISDDYLPQWREFAVSRDGTHTKLAYHWYGSWGSMYNLYADALLCFNQEDDGGYFYYDTYRNQSNWYWNVHQSLGLPLDVRHMYSKTDWEQWTASITSEQTRHHITETMGKWLNTTTNVRPFPDIYNTESGDNDGINFMARPVAGGHFAAMALERACNGTAFDSVKAIFGESYEEKVLDVAAILEADAEGMSVSAATTWDADAEGGKVVTGEEKGQEILGGAEL